MTNVPRGVSVRELITALRKDGFELMRTRGSHRFYQHTDGRQVSIPYHRLSDTFAIGTLKALVKDLGWEDEDLKRLGLV
jgi:predicted RNA binding protein YcfA (HicA-like mRNA interferase family)